MIKELSPQSIRNLGIYGVIRENEVDGNLIPDGAVTEAKNVHFDRKGAVSLRPGIASLGSTISSSNSCLGLFNVQSATMISAFIQSGSLTVSSWDGSSSWNTSLTGTGGSTAARFIDFASRTLFISGLERSIKAWNGSADGTSYWDVSGNPINAQQLWYVNGNTNTGYIRPKYGEVYKSRIYLSGDSTNPSRLYFSSVISTSGNVTWSPTTDFVDINPNDGENITAIKRYSLELDIFKPNYIYRFRTSGVDPDPLVKVGTRSQESIVEGKNGLYFHNDNGFFVYTGGYPTEISRPISDFVSAIPFSQFSNIAGWRDSDHIYWFVGNLTINEPVDENVTWNNVVLRYTESSQLWTIYSYPFGLTRGATFVGGSALSQVIGSDAGYVSTFNSGSSDLGEPIKYRMVTKWYEWDGIVNRKTIQKLIAMCEKEQGVTLQYRVDDDPAWRQLGQLKSYLHYFDPIEIKFHRIRFAINGVSSSEAMIFKGLEIAGGINEGIIK